MSAQRWVIGILGVGALLGVAGALAARRLSRPTPAASEAALPDESWEDLPPDSTVFDAAPPSERYLTVRTRELAPRWSSADDLESLGSDDLGSAYLSRATEQGSFEEDSLEAELAGFQIIERG